MQKGKMSLCLMSMLTSICVLSGCSGASDTVQVSTSEQSAVESVSAQSSVSNTADVSEVSEISEEVQSSAESSAESSTDTPSAAEESSEIPESSAEESYAEPEESINEPEDVSIDEEPSVENISWKQLYVDAVRNDRIVSDYVDYALVNVDDDGIPELVCFGGDVAHGLIIAWIKDGTVVNEALGYSQFYYYPNENRFYAEYINHGMYGDTVYEFQNGSLVKLFEGTKLPEGNGFSDPGWFINNEHVSEDDYNSQFGSAFDIGRSTKATYSNRDQIIETINNY